VDLFGATMPVLHRDATFARGGTLRRELRRWWADEPVEWAVWLMLNPSDAGTSREDPTSMRVTHFTRAWGFGGWIGVNLYPFVASAPAAMWEWAMWQDRTPDRGVRDDLAANLEDIERVARMARIRVVAFGAQPAVRDPEWLEKCLVAFGRPAFSGDENFYCLGETKDGQPLHPMARGRNRVPDDRRPTLWQVSR
jgi:hypothetical protein